MMATILRACVAAVLLLAPAGSALAACPADPNVILIVADDLAASDLPFYSPPVDWGPNPRVRFNESAPDQAVPPHPDRDMRRDLNRLASRMMADPDPMVPNLGYIGTFSPPLLAPPATGTTPTTLPAYPVNPWDEDTVAPPLVYDALLPDDSPVAREILAGFGGLNRLATEGVTFSRYYATAGVCTPTRVSIVTGRYPVHAQTPGLGGDLPSDEVTIAEYLKAKAGYATGFVGKWHLGPYAWTQGFDEFVGHTHSCCRGYFSKDDLDCSPDPDAPAGDDGRLYVGPSPTGTCDAGSPPQYCCKHVSTTKKGERVYGFEVPQTDNVDELPDGSHAPCDTNDDTLEAPGRCNYSTRVYRDLAINFIRRHADATPREPYLLVVSFNAVHAGHESPKRTTEHYEGRPGSKKTYWGMIEEIDAAVGQILDAVDPTNTMVLFTSDQGSPGGGGPGMPDLRGGKAGAWDGGIRVGLVGKACNAESPSDVTAHIASHVDLFPTIADAVGHALQPKQTVGSCHLKPDEYCDPTDPTIPVRCEPPACIPIDCPTGTGPCDPHFVDGRSFYPLLVGASTAHHRDYNFARAGEVTVLSRPELTVPVAPGAGDAAPPRVCAFLGKGFDGVAVRGGSCESCTTDASCSDKNCHISRKVCVDPDVAAPGAPAGWGACQSANIDGTAPPCDAANCKQNRECDCKLCRYEYSQVGGSPEAVMACKTDADCGKTDDDRSDWECREVTLPCNGCVAASWKIGPRTGSGSGCPLPEFEERAKLFDLSSNPEESDDLNCAPKYPGTWRVLRQKVLNWNECTAVDQIGHTDCESDYVCP